MLRSRVKPWPNDVLHATHCIGLLSVTLTLRQDGFTEKQKNNFIKNLRCYFFTHNHEIRKENKHDSRNRNHNIKRVGRGIKKQEQAKRQIANEKKKINAERRKRETHLKIIAGGIIHKYLPDRFLFEEHEMDEIIK